MCDTKSRNLYLGQTAARWPVYLSDEGHFCGDQQGGAPADYGALGDALFRAAQLVDDGANPFSEHQLTQTQRRQIHDKLSAALELARAGEELPEGLDQRQALQLRSSAATVLLALLAASSTTEHDAQLAAEMLETYQTALEQETHPVLRDSMIFNLHGEKNQLSEAARALANHYMRELAPLSPPYDVWFADGNRTIKISWTAGLGSEGFYAGTVHLLKQEGFEARGRERRLGPATYERTYEDRDGQPVVVSITVKRNDDSIFDEMDQQDVQIVGYDGHSNIGRNIPASLRRAPDSANPKLVFYGLCAGKDNLSRVRERYPKAQLLTTFGSSYFTVEMVDGRKRMATSENFNVLKVLMADICQRRPWTVINRHIRDDAILYRYHHVMPGGTNYISPVHTLIRRRVLDTDHDGQADLLDRLATFNLFAVADNTDREFQALAPSRPATALDGTAVHLAAMAMDTALNYNQITQRYRKGRLIGAGYWEPPAGESAAVSFEESHQGTKDVLLMKVNHNYAHMGVDALRAVANYLLIIEIGRQRDELNLQDRRLMALAFAAFPLVYSDAPDRRVERIWSGLLGLMGLPAEIPYDPIHDLLYNERHFYSGSSTHVRQWKEHLSVETLAALETA